jgi:hypothetical protein
MQTLRPRENQSTQFQRFSNHVREGEGERDFLAKRHSRLEMNNNGYKFDQEYESIEIGLRTIKEPIA